MINKAELRIGNILLRGLSDEPRTVEAITSNGVYLEKAFAATLFEDLKPAHISPKALMDFGFENWGKKPGDTKWAVETEYVLHNAVDGTSDFKVVRTKYSFTNGETSIHWGVRIDQDDIYVRHLDYLHQLQNVFFSLVGYDLDFSEQKV